jgi:hypothetical protein
MSYLAIDQLNSDPLFSARVRACAVEQAETYVNDARPDFVALAKDQLVGGITYLTFVRIGAASPGIAEKADDGKGGVDQSQVSDGDILSFTQGNWQAVAGLHFTADGAPIEG